MRDFQIINDNVKIINNYIILTDYTEKEFNLEIESILLKLENNQVLAYVNYENDCEYLYIFDNDKNLLLDIENYKELKVEYDILNNNYNNLNMEKEKIETEINDLNKKISSYNDKIINLNQKLKK
jgi:septal ring factor EnvC (AmiA/AmiB activator)